MSEMTVRPRWWQLYVLGISVIALVVWAHSWQVSESVHGTINIGIVLCAYGVLNLWLALNGDAIDREKLELEEQTGDADDAITWHQLVYRRALRHKKNIKKL